MYRVAALNMSYSLYRNACDNLLVYTFFTNHCSSSKWKNKRRLEHSLVQLGLGEQDGISRYLECLKAATPTSHGWDFFATIPTSAFPYTCSFVARNLWSCTCFLFQGNNGSIKGSCKLSFGWWFQIFFIFTIFYPCLGKWSNLTNIFQMSWNHHLQ